MKKLIPIALLVLLTFFLFNFEKKNKFPDYVPMEVIEYFESEYVNTISREPLNTLLEENFSLLFDDVKSVDAQYSKDFGYYYIVFGSFNGRNKIELLKVNKSDIENETYSYIDFSNVNVTSSDNYCRFGPDEVSNPRFCEGPCALRDDCLGIICGVGTDCIEN